MLVIIALVSAWALLLWLVVGLCASAHAGDAGAPPAERAVGLGGPPARRELNVTAARPDDLAA
ncbi:MAG TPA: hypothetical protein VL979_10010 [Solirubrobacteraceae bacterium]|nr:hypothetical protein [Solirubrobacteraceae bacterium]